ncbi:response regulator [Acidaminobacter sp. JC074]|uniref:DNA-binding domain-containing protein n=1 Tax=Acidaminobacter sp. JC074 TaxID=2530199 RepID=UPI001F0D3C03|nr:DNA-binding domain-containing protein [Acidaminobacter sp. JC074]MCH4889386.1 response regulator [Acidaminobacter sp. JC074]
MNYLVLDDDINVVKIIKTIVEEDFNNRVIAYGTDPKKAIDDILVLKPDVVIIDYLMPELDGVDVVKKIREVHKDVDFIMISQVSDKEMIGQAYKEGISFFISKPINRFEVLTVLKHITEKIETTRKLDQIVNLIGHVQPASQVRHEEVAKSVLKDLGIYSEKGSKDIMMVIELKQSEAVTIDEAIKKVCKSIGENPKIIRQRMRRAVNKGLRNLAYLGIEDYMNELFIKYSSALYDFESVKKEMDYVRGKSAYKGSVSLDKFLENLSEF